MSQLIPIAHDRYISIYFRIYIPRETCLVTFLLSGVECPRAARIFPGGVEEAAEPYGNEALQFTKDLIMQREVEVEVESADKGARLFKPIRVLNAWCCASLSVCL